MGKWKEHFILTDQDGVTQMMVEATAERDAACEAEPQNETLLRAAEVEAMTSLDIKTIDRLIARNRFPASVHLSDRRKAWRRSAVLEWMADPCGWESAF